MFSILGGIIGIFLASIGNSNRKKALNIGKLSKGIFKFSALIIAFFIILLLIIIFGFEIEIFYNYKILGLMIIIIFFGVLNTFLDLYILKNTKLSEILPYDNLDKLFIIIIGYFLFLGTKNGTSIITFLISIFTIIIIILFTINIKNFKIPKIIGLLSIHKLIKAGTFLLTGYVLIKYSSITFASLYWFIELIFVSIIIIITKDNFKILFLQEKQFYKNRVFATIFGRIAWLIGLFVIKESGIIVATLLGFLSIAFSILSMKFILKDNPTKKQIILAFIVILLIGIGFYFK